MLREYTKFSWPVKLTNKTRTDYHATSPMDCWIPSSLHLNAAPAQWKVKCILVFEVLYVHKSCISYLSSVLIRDLHSNENRRFALILNPATLENENCWFLKYVTTHCSTHWLRVTLHMCLRWIFFIVHFIISRLLRCYREIIFRNSCSTSLITKSVTCHLHFL